MLSLDDQKVCDSGTMHKVFHLNLKTDLSPKHHTQGGIDYEEAFL